MSTTMTPMNFLAGTAAMGAHDPEWMLDQAPHGSPERLFRSRVNFETPFACSPLVHLGIAGLDASSEDSTRITTKAENISTHGFDIVLTTWLHSRLWRVDMNWLAIGP